MIDSHSHIYGKRFDEDRDAVIQRAVERGIEQLLQVACNLPECRQVIDLAERVPGIYASLGVHPHDADTVNDQVLDQIEALLTHAKVVAWGEIGLDFYYDNSPRAIQQDAFERQLARAIANTMPVVIHTRDAEPETLEIMRRNPNPRGGHVHCFTGSLDMAKSLLDLGYDIGFTGIITFKSAASLREVVDMVPLERLLIETDSPYLAPIPYRGKRNEPAYVAEVAAAVAEIKGVAVEKVHEVTNQNFYRVYDKAGLTWETLAAVAT